MSDTYLKNEEVKEKSSLPTRFLKFVFFVCLFFSVIFLVLGNMGGSNDEYKQAVESYISRFFGGRVTHVDTLVNVNFFPSITLNVKGVNVMSHAQDTIPVFTVDHLVASMSFWDVATQSTWFKKFYVEGLRAMRGLLGAQEVYVEKIYVDHDTEAKTAQLRGSGKLGIHAWDFTGDLEIAGSKGSYKYTFGQAFPVAFHLADIEATATFIKHEDGYLKLENVVLKSDERELNGEVTLSLLEGRLMKFKGDLKDATSGEVLSFDTVIDMAQYPSKYSGEITSDGLTLSNWVGEQSVMSIIMRLKTLLGHDILNQLPTMPRNVIGNFDTDLQFNLSKVRLADGVERDIDFKLVQENDRLKFGPLHVGGEDALPPLLVFFEYEKGKLVSILEDGNVDVSVLRPFAKHLPSKLMTQDKFISTCGMAILSPANQGQVNIDLLGLNFDNAAITVQEKVMGAEQSVLDLHYQYRGGDVALQTVSVNEDTYDFLAASLERSSAASPCGQYLTKVERKKPQEPSAEQVSPKTQE